MRQLGASLLVCATGALTFILIGRQISWLAYGGWLDFVQGAGLLSGAALVGIGTWYRRGQRGRRLVLAATGLAVILLVVLTTAGRVVPDGWLLCALAAAVGALL